MADVWDNIEAGKYEMTAQMPPTPPTRRKIADSMADTFVGTRREFDAEVERLYELSRETAKRLMDEWHARRNALFRKFKADLIEECGLTGHGKVERCWELAKTRAYEKGGGFQAIYDEFVELAELLKED